MMQFNQRMNMTQVPYRFLIFISEKPNIVMSLKNTGVQRASDHLTWSWRQWYGWQWTPPISISITHNLPSELLNSWVCPSVALADKPDCFFLTMALIHSLNIELVYLGIVIMMNWCKPINVIEVNMTPVDNWWIGVKNTIHGPVQRIKHRQTIILDEVFLCKPENLFYCNTCS